MKMDALQSPPNAVTDRASKRAQHAAPLRQAAGYHEEVPLAAGMTGKMPVLLRTKPV